jgi:hypothetical protein
MPSLVSDVSFNFNPVLARCTELTWPGYYISIPAFKAWPMKKLSSPIGIIWEADPNKSLWSLMTKAWSAMRDQIGKDKAPLDEFFRIICPALDMPSPIEYLEMNGWKVGLGKDGGPSLSREKDFQSSPVNTDMALSVEDIITYCKSSGYAQDYVPDNTTTSATFLGHTAGMSAAFVQNYRFNARNGRRARRQDARNTASTLAPSRIEQMSAHSHGSTEMSQLDYPSFFDTPTNPFYDNLARLLTNDLASQSANTDLASDNSSASTMHGAQVSVDTDWSAFPADADDMASHPDNTDLASDNSSASTMPGAQVSVDTDWTAFRAGADANVAMPAYRSPNV